MGKRADNNSNFEDIAESYIMMARELHASTGRAVRYHLEMAEIELMLELAQRLEKRKLKPVKPRRTPATSSTGLDQAGSIAPLCARLSYVGS